MKTQDSGLPTRGQLERSLSQSIQALYRKQLGHQPSKVTCRLLDRKIVIVMEDSITQAEQVLASATADDKLVEQVRNALDTAIEADLKQLIQEKIGVEIVDLLSDSTVETGRLGIIVVLANDPETRQPDSAAKKL
ncbi:DUF2294 domain-containing protein [filamentous cyanobacterium LEGE 11480]|uniref:DUF2294 domain-containing protein n=1 Tax=Romeriopsis navalis LEGE 11480 TaxID=2777977 RepID=A0A928VN50_9CYAN|nr:DUF2294 domain-containing protein [Romeriopsis navalis]MBE9031380.1 DUF2294 domain-containing protein [Romeriopsis navalis LEGE 11480]